MSWNEDIRLLNKEVSNISINLNRLKETVASYVKRLLPEGGNTGDALVKTTAEDWSMAWRIVSSGSSTTGSDGVFDCGDRMTGEEVHDMGNRI